MNSKIQVTEFFLEKLKKSEMQNNLITVGSTIVSNINININMTFQNAEVTKKLDAEKRTVAEKEQLLKVKFVSTQIVNIVLCPVLTLQSF